MTTSSMRRSGTLAALMVAALITAACGSGDDGADDRADGGVPAAGAVSDPVAEEAARDAVIDAVTGSGEGRAFDADDATVAEAINRTMSPDEIRWEGDTLYVVFDRPAEEAKLRINCSTADTLLAPQERVVVVYTDQEVDCTELLG